MGFKLTKAEIDRRDEIVAELREKYADVEKAVDEFNNEVARMKGPIADAINAYNEKVETARGFCEDIASTREGEFDDKSENWQESERGQSVQEWISEWEGADCSEIEEIEINEIEAPESSIADDLEALPTEAEA